MRQLHDPGPPLLDTPVLLEPSVLEPGLLEPPPAAAPALDPPLLDPPLLDPPLLETPVLDAPPLDAPRVLETAVLGAPLDAPLVGVTWVLGARALPVPPDEPPLPVAPHALAGRAAATRLGISYRCWLRPGCEPPARVPSPPTPARSFRSAILGPLSVQPGDRRRAWARTDRPPRERSGDPVARLRRPGCDCGVMQA